jgi:uncharacterized protein YcaQ
MTALRSATPLARALAPVIVRRLALTRQRLAGPRPATGAAGIMEVARDLGALQLDPINVVARSHLLVLRSRLGQFAPGAVATLLYEERQLFEYWAHCASLVLTEDYPIHRMLMRRRLADETATETPQSARAHAWVSENRALATHVLERLRADGPLPLNAFEDRAVSGWTSTGWTSGRNVARMIDHLWLRGEAMVGGRTGIHRLWDLSERVLPAWAPREEWTDHAVVRAAALRAIRALGVARPAQIAQHFTRGRYPGLTGVLAELVAEGTIAPVAIVPPSNDPATVRAWAGPWYVHTADLPTLDRLAADVQGNDWGPRTTLLSPFDNLICDRKRTKLLFDFDFTIEIYVPQAKRRWGYYVLPILHNDRLIGRVDPTMDRANGRLVINAIYAEPGVPHLGRAGGAVARAITELGRFLGAREIVYPEAVPAPWARALKRA